MKPVIKRIYEPVAPTDGYRILVDRIWPRGMQKEKAHIDLWMKDIAPSTALRKWFNHEPEKYRQFISKYRQELDDSGVLKELRAIIKQHKTVTLLYSAKDEIHNQASALLEIMKKV